MKKRLVLVQLFGVLVFLFTGWPLQCVQIEPVTSSHAMGYIPDHFRNHGRNHGRNHANHGNPGGNNGGGTTYQVPEPSSLALLGTGIGGIGIFYAFARRNRKK